MDLISLVVTLAILGVVLYMVETLPMEPMIKIVIRVVVVLAVCAWLLQVFGIARIPLWRR